jgi:hypothetical protein
MTSRAPSPASPAARRPASAPGRGQPHPGPHAQPSPAPGRGPAPAAAAPRAAARDGQAPGRGAPWTIASVSAIASGLALVVAPALAGPGWAYLVALGGAIAVVAAVRQRWTSVGTLAATAAITECVVSHLSTVALAGEGLLLLAFLLFAAAPATLAPEVAGRWLRLQAPAALAGLTATALVLAALAAKPVAATWLIVAGLIAAVAAYLIAAPRRPK